MHNSSRRTGEKLLPNAIRECPVVRGCREKNQGESFLVDTAQGRFGGWWIWFLFHFPNRHAKFRKPEFLQPTYYNFYYIANRVA